MWRVSLQSEELLCLESSFSLASPPSLLVSTQDRLCVARNNHELASYTLDIFNITGQGRDGGGRREGGRDWEGGLRGRGREREGWLEGEREEGGKGE